MTTQVSTHTPVLTPADCSATLLHQTSHLCPDGHSTSFDSDNDDSGTHNLRLPSSLSRSPVLAHKSRSRSSTLDSIGSAALDRIEYIEITKKIKRDGVRYYVVDVYEHRSEQLKRASAIAYSPATPSSRLSESEWTDLMLRERESDYQVEHRFDAFRELKNALHAVADKHADQQCQHCHTLSAYLAHSENQSWTVKRLVKSSASRQALLSKFLNGVLSLTSESDANNRLCLANDEVIEMVERFLRRQHVRSLGII